MSEAHLAVGTHPAWRKAWAGQHRVWRWACLPDRGLRWRVGWRGQFWSFEERGLGACGVVRASEQLPQLQLHEPVPQLHEMVRDPSRVTCPRCLVAHDAWLEGGGGDVSRLKLTKEDHRHIYIGGLIALLPFHKQKDLEVKP